MAEIKEDYVSFEIAKLLEEKGFGKYPLFPCYKEDNGEFINTSTTLDTINYCFIPAPTLQMAMKWLREIHNTNIDIVSVWNQKRFEYQVFVATPENAKHCYVDDKLYLGYEEACETAIKYCLENLI